MIKKISTITLLLISLIIVGCSSNTSNQINESETEDLISILNIPELCERNNGKWIESANECEGISKPLCEDNGGVFNSCGSACRNDPKAEICTMQCIMYCDFSKLNNNNLNDNKDDNFSIEIMDSYENIVPNNCATWFDGCNLCQVDVGGTMACTKKACSQSQLENSYCEVFR